MSRERLKLFSLALGAAVVVAAVSLWRSAFASAVSASGDGQPIMTVVDERDCGEKSPSPTVYVLWPGQKRVEAFSSRTLTFVTYDFVRGTVVHRDADLR